MGPPQNAGAQPPPTQTAERWLRVTGTIRLNPDAHQVRVVARDLTSDATRSVIITAPQIEKRSRPATLRGTGMR